MLWLQCSKAPFKNQLQLPRPCTMTKCLTLVYPFKYSINDPKECFRLASCTARGPGLYRYDQDQL